MQFPSYSEPPDVAAAERYDPTLALRRSMVRQLEPLLPQGVDTSKIDALFADYQQRRDELLKQRLLELRQTMSALAQQRGAGLSRPTPSTRGSDTTGTPLHAHLHCAEAGLDLGETRARSWSAR